MKRKILWSIILMQALGAILGSLYFSNFWDPFKGLFNDKGMEPCNLCRWARILIYPVLYLAIYALIKKDDDIAYLTWGIGIAGMALTGYHHLIQQQQAVNIFSCGVGNDCAVIDWSFGFLTIPLLAFIAFVIVSICSGVVLFSKKSNK